MEDIVDELVSLETIVEALTPLDPDTRGRVVRYIVDRFDIRKANDDR